MHLLCSGIVLAASSVLAVRIASCVQAFRSSAPTSSGSAGSSRRRVSAFGRWPRTTTRLDLATRRAAIDRMRDELAVRGRPEPLMSLALRDIDHFKLINDGHGHAVGDADALRSSDGGQWLLVRRAGGKRGRARVAARAQIRSRWFSTAWGRTQCATVEIRGEFS